MTHLIQIPTFHVKTMRDALTFYEGVLGFTQDWQWQHEDNFPIFASVTRGGHTLYLTEHEECTAGGLAYLYLPTSQDVDEYYAVIRENGDTSSAAPIDQPWALRELHVTDPDGNKIRFCARL